MLTTTQTTVFYDVDVISYYTRTNLTRFDGNAPAIAENIETVLPSI
jgi:hypothetical protein